MSAATACDQTGRRGETSATHIALALAFSPGQRLLHRFALLISQAHFRQDGLRVDLLGDLRRRRRRGDRQDLMVVRIWIVIERPLRRAFFRPGLQGGELLECWQVVAAARCHELLNRSGLRQMDQQALGGFLVLGEIPHTPEIWKERRKAALRTDREAVSPALLRDLWRVALGYR